MKKTLLAAASLALLSTVFSANAALMPVTATDPSAVAPYDQTTMLGSNSFAGAQAFQSKLMAGSVKTLDLEGLNPGTGYPTNNNIAVQFKSASSPASTASAALTGTGRVDNTPFLLGTDPPEFQGRFNTTLGTQMDVLNYWESIGSFGIKFDDGTRFNAFGFYGTDFGDFGGSLSIEFWANGVLRDSLMIGGAGSNLPATVNDDDTGNGTLRFVGAYNDAANVLYDEVRFTITQGTASTDALGFDDFFIGMFDTSGGGGGTVPEPGTLALVGASLLALGAARRRRQA